MSDNLWNAFCATVAREPERAAILMGERRLTFGQWHQKAERWAGQLLRAGLQRHDRVLVWMPPSPEMAAVMVGVWAAGGIVVLMDPSERVAHLIHAIERVRPFAIVRGPGTVLPDVAGGLPVPVISVDETDPIHPLDSALPGAGALSTDPASVVFTSGSTGRPKGVTQSHGNLARGCRAVAGYLGLRSADVILCPVPWSFDYGFGQLLSTIVVGPSLVLPEALNSVATCTAIETHRPSVFAGTPSVFGYLLYGPSSLRGTDLASIRTVTNTGGTIPRPILNELLTLFDHSRIFLNYGLTESYRTASLDPALVRTHPTSIGRGIPGVDVIVVRANGSIADPDEEGEIVHRGDYICMGYWDDPDATTRAIRPDPLAPPGCPSPPRALFTGDYGVIDGSGLLYFKGRRDQQMKCMGVRVSPPDVEDLIHASTMVKEVAVFGMPHDLMGDEVWAAVVPADGFDGVATQLARHARSAMSRYMAPSRYLVLSELPKTRTGKTDYVALKEVAAKQRQTYGKDVSMGPDGHRTR